MPRASEGFSAMNRRMTPGFRHATPGSCETACVALGVTDVPGRLLPIFPAAPFAISSPLRCHLAHHQLQPDRPEESGLERHTREPEAMRSQAKHVCRVLVASVMAE